jgi:hypothetical protein
MLLEGSKEARAEAARFLERLAISAVGSGTSRERLLSAASGVASAKLRPEALAIVREAGEDLAAHVPDLPEGSLAADWAYLCRQMASDVRRGGEATLDALERLRGAVVRTAGARMYVVGSAETHAAIAPDLVALVKALGAGPALPPIAPGPRAIDERLRAREPAAVSPVFVGLVNPATQSGAFLHATRGPGYLDAGDDALLDHLASNLYAGSGAHGIFIKTWAAGLAYSNGVGADLGNARLTYYAERCPELPQTMRFVIDELHEAKPDESIVRYALADSFQSRLAATYEDRGRALADDLADGVTPERVRTFREGLLRIARRPRLVEELSERFPKVYARVLPGYAPGWTADADAVYLTIGPTAQLDAWQKHLASAVGPDAKLFRLYPRDFWIPAGP